MVDALGLQPVAADELPKETRRGVWMAVLPGSGTARSGNARGPTT